MVTDFIEMNTCDSDFNPLNGCDIATTFSTPAPDCAGIPAGDGVVDDCGVCNGGNFGDQDGDGICDANDETPNGDAQLVSSYSGLNEEANHVVSLDYTSSSPIHGFQFTVSGATVLGISASDAFDLVDCNSATGVCLGFSIAGGTLDAGSGTLATLTLANDNNQDATLTISDVLLSIQDGLQMETSGPDALTLPACEQDCAMMLYLTRLGHLGGQFWECFSVPVRSWVVCNVCKQPSVVSGGRTCVETCLLVTPVNNAAVGRPLL